MSLPTACFGPLLGLYFVGLTLPWIGKRPVFYGAIIGVVSLSAIVFKAQAEMALGNMKSEYKPLSVDGCEYNFSYSNNSVSSTEPTIEDRDQERYIYQVSYLYYTLLGSTIVVISSFILSFIFGFQDPTEVDPRLIAPALRKYFRREHEVVQVLEADSHELTFMFGRENEK